TRRFAPSTSPQCPRLVEAREIRYRIALRVEQRREVAMVDPHAGGGGDGGLCMVGDAEARLREHGQGVRAIAPGERLRSVETEGLAPAHERIALCRPAEDRLANRAGQAAVPAFENV